MEWFHMQRILSHQQRRQAPLHQFRDACARVRFTGSDQAAGGFQAHVVPSLRTLYGNGLDSGDSHARSFRIAHPPGYQ